MIEKCYLKTKQGVVEVEYLGMYQFSRVVDESPLIGGHPGGVEAYPVAVVKFAESLMEVRVSELSFIKPNRDEVLIKNKVGDEMTISIPTFFEIYKK